MGSKQHAEHLTIDTSFSVVKRLQQALRQAHTREHDLLHKLSELKQELRLSAEQQLLLKEQAWTADLQEAFQIDDAQQFVQHWTAAGVGQLEQQQLSQRSAGPLSSMQDAHRQAILALKQEQLQLLQEHQQLLDVLALKEEQVAQLATEAAAAQVKATAAERKCTNMEGVWRSTAEQAAAAESAVEQWSTAVVQLQRQLADLKERHQACHCQLQAQHVGETGPDASRGRTQACGLACVLAPEGQAPSTEHAAVQAELAAFTQQSTRSDTRDSTRQQQQLTLADTVIGCQEDLAVALAQQLDAALAAQEAQAAELALQPAAGAVVERHQQEQQLHSTGELQGAWTAQAAEEACGVATASFQTPEAVAASHVEKVLPERSTASLGSVWCQWRLVTEIGKGHRARLELEAVRIQLEHLQHTTAAHSKLLSAYLKHRAKVQAAAAQQQQAKHALHAWQRQALRQQEAAWAWRGLAKELLLQDPNSQACDRQYTRHDSAQLHYSAASEAQEGPLSEDHSWEDAAGSAAVLCAAQVAGMQACGVACCLGSSNYYMKRLLHRRRGPQGSCRAAAAEGKLLVAALKAWRMTSRLQGKARAMDEAEQQLEATSAGLAAWIGLLGDQRRLERAWLGWRLAALRGGSANQTAPEAASMPQQQQQPQQNRWLKNGQGQAAAGTAGLAGRSAAGKRGASAPAAQTAGPGLAAFVSRQQGLVQQQQQQMQVLTHQRQQQQQQQLAGALGTFTGSAKWQVNAAPTSMGTWCLQQQQQQPQSQEQPHPMMQAMAAHTAVAGPAATGNTAAAVISTQNMTLQQRPPGTGWLVASCQSEALPVQTPGGADGLQALTAGQFTPAAPPAATGAAEAVVAASIASDSAALEALMAPVPCEPALGVSTVLAPQTGGLELLLQPGQQGMPAVAQQQQQQQPVADACTVALPLDALEAAWFRQQSRDTQQQQQQQQVIAHTAPTGSLPGVAGVAAHAVDAAAAAAVGACGVEAGVPEVHAAPAAAHADNSAHAQMPSQEQPLCDDLSPAQQAAAVDATAKVARLSAAKGQLTTGKQQAQAQLQQLSANRAGARVVAVRDGNQQGRKAAAAAVAAGTAIQQQHSKLSLRKERQISASTTSSSNAVGRPKPTVQAGAPLAGNAKGGVLLGSKQRADTAGVGANRAAAAAAAAGTLQASGAGAAAAADQAPQAVFVPTAAVPKRAASCPGAHQTAAPPPAGAAAAAIALVADAGPPPSGTQGDADSSLQEYLQNEAISAAAAASSRVVGSLSGIASHLSSLQQHVQQHTVAIGPAGRAVQIRASSPMRHQLTAVQQQRQWPFMGENDTYPLQDSLQEPQRPPSPAWQPVGIATASAAARTWTVKAQFQEPTATQTANSNSSNGAAVHSRGTSPVTVAAQRHVQKPTGAFVMPSGGISRGNSPARPAGHGQQQKAAPGGLPFGSSSSSRTRGVSPVAARGGRRSTSPLKLAAGVQAQLAGYHKALVQLESNLHVATRPWSTVQQPQQQQTAQHHAGVLSSSAHGLQAVVVRPQSPTQAVPLSPTAAAQAQAVTDAQASGEWQVVSVTTCPEQLRQARGSVGVPSPAPQQGGQLPQQAARRITAPAVLEGAQVDAQLSAAGVQPQSIADGCAVFGPVVAAGTALVGKNATGGAALCPPEPGVVRFERLC